MWLSTHKRTIYGANIRRNIIRRLPRVYILRQETLRPCTTTLRSAPVHLSRAPRGMEPITTDPLSLFSLPVTMATDPLLQGRLPGSRSNFGQTSLTQARDSIGHR